MRWALKRLKKLWKVFELMPLSHYVNLNINETMIHVGAGGNTRGRARANIVFFS